jgi:hypothetical protein
MHGNIVHRYIITTTAAATTTTTIIILRFLNCDMKLADAVFVDL